MKLTTPMAAFLGIAVAGAFIAVALFVVLRERAPTSVSSAAGSTPADPTTAEGTRSPAFAGSGGTESATARGVAPPVARLQVPASKDAVATEVSAALEAYRSTVMRDCWAPAVAAHPGSPPQTWVFNFTFGADGSQIVRGVTAVGKDGGVDVTTCVLAAVKPLKLAPPGASTYVEVPFTLP